MFNSRFCITMRLIAKVLNRFLMWTERGPWCDADVVMLEEVLCDPGSV